jgi:Peptidase family M23/Putative peptidoglycan binding domain
MRRVRIVRGAAYAAWMLLLVAAPQANADGANVAALQAALQSKGLYRVAVDGVRGPLTTRGVRSFQRRHGLLVDGIAGPETRRALGRSGRPALGARVMRQGQRGWDVAALQFLLRRRGHTSSAVDGVFGPATREALISFQRAAGLEVDGLAGSATIAALRRNSGSTLVSAPQGPVRFYRPVQARISDSFGAPRPGGRRHAGIDFAAPSGTPVQAVGVGTVIFAGYNSGGYGNLVVIQHRLGYTTWYAHLSRITSRVGESVSGGTRIGYVGSTGFSTGPHLHFEARKWNVPFDPLPYMLAGTAARAARPLRCHEPARYRTARIDDCRPG